MSKGKSRSKKLNLDFQVKDFHISLFDKWDGVDKA